MRVIFRNEAGRISVLTPTQEALSFMTLMQIAVKDVPAGRPFKFIEASAIPIDREQRLAWVVDDSEFTDGIGTAE